MRDRKSGPSSRSTTARGARSTPRNVRGIEVFKFGGASVADAAAMRHAIDIVMLPRRTRTAVVVSAMAGVTDALIGLTDAAETGDQRDIDVEMAILHRMHRDVAAGIVASARARKELLGEVARSFDDLRSWLEGVRSLRELTPRSRDLIIARGEELSARLIVAGLLARGVRAEYIDATGIIPTDGKFGGAFPDLGRADRAIRERLLPMLKRGVVPIVPGFTGGAPDGAVVTLGRGGSDLTATVLGRALRAERITLWKDVPGLMTTDPRLVPSARVVPQLNTREAAELAYYGAKVLHPRALIPLARVRVPVFVRPFANPDAAGTEISSRRTLDRYPVKALSVIRGQALVTITGNGMLGVPGIAARTFAALQRAGVSVALISQASSEHSICLCVPADRAVVAREALTEAFGTELARRELEGVDVQRGMAMLAVVGLGMAGSPGIAARMFKALSGANVNIVAIAQGSSELNISVVIAEPDAAAAAHGVHDEFQMDKIGGGGVRRDDQLDVVLLGFGQIGRELVRMLPQLGAKSRPNVVALIDRSGFVFSPDGLSLRRLETLTNAKAKGIALAATPGAQAATAREAVAYIAGHALARTVLVDLTADDTMSTLRTALAADMDIVLANKRPLSASLPQVEALRALAERQHRRILHETTVGAGLPVMDSYAKLVETGDRVLRIEGCTSGTLGFLLSELGKGRAFSATVRDAMSRGFTEPDPRDDLSGMDVARKALILARLLGFRGEMSDVSVESLVPQRLRKMPLDKFLATLESQDAEWAERQAAAARQGRVLRYVLEATQRKVVVGLRAVPTSHPLASLRGTDNQIVFTTMRYNEHPLVITGPGAGPEVTAAGVLNDILQLAT